MRIPTRGRKGSFQAATQAAASEGGKVFTQTVGGQVLATVTNPLPERLATPILNWGSKQFAQGASGTVRAVLREPLRTNSTWSLVEHPLLRVNPFVRISSR